MAEGNHVITLETKLPGRKPTAVVKLSHRFGVLNKMRTDGETRDGTPTGVRRLPNCRENKTLSAEGRPFVIGNNVSPKGQDGDIAARLRVSTGLIITGHV